MDMKEIHKVNVHGSENDGIKKEKKKRKQKTKISTGCEWLKRDNGMLKKTLALVERTQLPVRRFKMSS